ncbi:uncharacterized protein [Clytia hemisphaerica]|uniref:uncharacterized protein n=1 Tax=Clytia hemisphaerica TaxID=252671 RepID=UPI0034D510FA
MAETEIKIILFSASGLEDQILDIIQDYAPDDIKESPELIKSCATKIETLRNQFREKHRELRFHLQDQDGVYEQSYSKQLTLITSKVSEYVKCLTKYNIAISATSQATQEHKSEFAIDDLTQSMKHLKTTITFIAGKCTNEDLKQRKKDLSSVSTEFNSLSLKMKELLDLNIKPDKFASLKKDYDMLLELRLSYQSSLQEEIKTRELDKLDNFKKSQLNIKLPTFTGYDSHIDIYTFNSEFNKLFSDIPKSYQSDLLKNNHLGKHALELVKNVTDIQDIWTRLKDAFGDRRLLLSNKLSKLNSIDLKHKDSIKITESLSKVINVMRDLMHLASDHNIENELYYGDALTHLSNKLGQSRMMRWLTLTCESPREGKYKWKQMIEFLEKEIKVQQQVTVIQSNTKTSNSTNDKEKDKRKSGSSTYYGSSDGKPQHQQHQEPICFICGATNHIKSNGPRGTKLIQYFSCKKFVDMTTSQRFKFLQDNGLCYQCLYPGAQMDRGKHAEGKCQRDFICKNPAHNSEITKKHVLVCDDHKFDQTNKDVLEHYKSRCIRRLPVPTYSKDIKIFHTSFKSSHSTPTDDSNSAIFMLQSIQINKRTYTIFYDSGCSDFISRFEAVRHLGSNAIKQFSGDISMGGVGGSVNITSHGVYTISIPLSHGVNAMMTGPCMDRITETFPSYPLQGRVYEDIKTQYLKEGNKLQFLPSVPKSIGGDVDFMVGIRYQRYFPEPIFQLPSGLTIYRSQFINADGSTGVIGGPHEVFNNVGSSHLSTHFISNQLALFRNGYQVNPDVRMLGYSATIGDVTSNNTLDEDDDVDVQKLITFNEAERAGSEWSFRCVNCRGCETCRNQPNEIMSIKEETEQQIINDSVTVDVQNHQSIATLPLMADPTHRLQPNRHIALKVYNQQVHRLAKNTKDREDILHSEQKLQKLGYVDYVKNLSTESQQILKESPYQNFIPWRAVWKESSVSTPCRVVFDASMPTDTGFSLNDILAKGRNSMNRLVDIFVRWRCHSVVFHTDVQKMYNSIKLDQCHWGLQRYLWQDSLDPSQPPEEKVIKTLIYGIKSSGNQAERGLRETARILKDRYPTVHKIVSEDVYVDDCLSGSSGMTEVQSIADDLEVAVNHGGFGLKGFTFSSRPPQESLSADGQSVGVAGLKWFPLKDQISLDVQELNFAKKSRGRKPTLVSTVPENLTRRQCVAKVAELYDITGLITPIVATMKLDLHDLVTRKLDWDDALPDNIRTIWLDHFDMMNEIKQIKYQRAVVPEDAASLDIQTLDFGDASKSLICVAIYVRFKKKDGSFSCQFIFGRSKLISDEYTQPRAELYAAMINAHSGHTIKQALKDKHKSSIKFTDSQISLYWICNLHLNLKQWTRNRVSEVHRFTDTSQWKYVRSEDMIADLGTRRCTAIQDVDQHSKWINGYEWMRSNPSDFPAKTTTDISLTAQEKQHLKKESREEVHKEGIECYISSTKSMIPEAVSNHYKYSNYLIDPNWRNFNHVIRVMAYVLKFINSFKKFHKPNPSASTKERHLLLNDADIERAKSYYFKKATSEVKQFTNKTKYNKISEEKDGILFYTGRILPTDQITAIGKATAIMKDLTALTFCVPIIDKNSPLAYSIVQEVHWNHPTAIHSGIETTWRYVLQTCYILEGRSLVKQVRSSCPRCRYLLKRKFQVIMGPLSEDNLKIAPAFFVAQTDLAGPFQSYSEHHKRTTVKIWLLVFCCATTTAVKIKVMDSYNTTSFLQAFTRLACEVGYPKKLLVDEGSQLVKGCETMQLNFVDLQQHLHSKMNIDFETCPVGGHNVNGRVERKIQEIKKSIDKTAGNQRLSILHWETLASTISNSINNLPLAVGNFKEFEMSDLITPNRLLLGRNNDRSPSEPLTVTNDTDKILRTNKKIFDSWFECWLTSHVPALMDQPKWFKNDNDIKPGDIVLFTKQESSLSANYQFGIVKSINKGRDGKIRDVIVQYQNSTEKVKRETHRSVRSLVLIRGVDEIDLMKQLDNSKN